MQTILALTASFLLGSIPTAYIVVKSQQQKDIRQMGSGNVGSMNVRDQLGYKPAIIVLLVDAAKGAAAVGLGLFLGADPELCLATAVAGHIYPPWLAFKGGKGLATALGGLLVLWQWPAILAFVVLWLLVYFGFSGRDGDWANLAGALAISAYAVLPSPEWGLLLLGLVIALKHFMVIKSQSGTGKQV
ncbi:MAG: glycerol-3-phosphate acyltransferase [Syntrophomonadaceae bacterium]|nr:glycerol-3-phosphate acyltransferase [Syntrophomonadaceae bacterium]